ncbi:MAG: hypothetical protein KKC71_09240 [Chloroflexi bacterium]|nr:hypothetical protein [Chloroflexota bacterium]
MLDVHTATIETAIRGCAVVATYSLNTVQLSPRTGYVEGEVAFVDGSRLIFFEFLRQAATGLDRENYRYHFMDASSQLLFRYDNAPHHPGMATFPHHKHVPGGVTDSLAPKFAEVLAEVETRILGIP